MRIEGLVSVLLLALCPNVARCDEKIWAQYDRAWTLTNQLHTTEAIPLLESIIAHDRKFYLGYKTLARAYYYKQDFASGERYFQKLVDKYPGDGLAHFGFGLFLAYFKRDVASRREMARCIERSEPAPYLYGCYSAFPVSRRGDLPQRGQTPENDVYARLSLAQHLRAFWRYAEAEQLLMPALVKARSLHYRELEAMLLFVLANTTQDKRHRVDLTTQSRQLWEETGDRYEALQTAPYIVWFMRDIGEREKAEEELSRYQQIAEQWQSPSHVGEFVAQRAVLCVERNSLDEALRLTLRARGMLEPYPPDAAYFDTFHQAGEIHRRLGRVAEATTELEGLWRAAVKAKNRAFEGYGLRYLGDLAADMGDYFKALQKHTASFAIFDELGRRGVGFRNTSGASLTRLGKIYVALGDYPAAAVYFRKALAIATASADWDPQERVHVELGNLYVRTSRPGRALEELALAQKANARTRNAVFEPSTLLSIGRAYRQLKRLPEALEMMTESLKAAERLETRADQAEALIELGITRLHAGDQLGAEQNLTASLALAESLDSLRLIAPARVGLADLEESRGDRKAALDHLLRAIQVLEEIRNRVPGSTLKAGLQSQSSDVYERAVDLLAKDGQPQKAFQLAEQGRARAFLDYMTEAVAHVTKGLPLPERERHARLTQAVSHASAAVLKDSSESNRRAVADAERELGRWIAETYTTYPQYSELRYPRPYNVDQARAALPDGETALIEFALGEQHSRAWLVSRNEFRMITLPSRRTLETKVNKLRVLMSHPPKGPAAFDAFHGPAEELYGLLFGPLERHLHGIRRLIIAPDGILHYLPFEALSHHGRYLVEDLALVYTPSISVYGNLAHVWKQKMRPGKRLDLLAFGDPAYGPGESIIRGVLERGGASFSRLPHTQAEVRKISALFHPPAQVRAYLGEMASESAFMREYLRGFQRIHLATHAFIDEQMPLRSGIVLTPGDEHEDGLLTMAEIFNLEVDADLVVLSACQTGLGQLVRGEGIVGLTRAFMYAGAPRVAVSLWEVNDLATAQFMERFYEGLRAGQPPAAALQSAKLSFIRGREVGLRHPYFWAPFVLVGVF